MTDVNFNSLLSEALKDRNEAEKAAEAKYNEEVTDLLKNIVLRVTDALNVEGDVRPALQAILDGTGKTETVTVEVPMERIVEKTVTDPRQEEQLQLLREENQQLKTEAGRVRQQLDVAQAKQAEAELALHNQEPAPTSSPLDPLKKLWANIQR